MVTPFLSAIVGSLGIASGPVVAPPVREDSSVEQIRAAAAHVPMDMRYTALDGRNVDLRKWRGKVVLIDFSAYTWCEGCREDVPRLVEIYRKYHDQGFEIAGFALEMSPKHRASIEKYVKDNDIQWPLYFDGKGMDNKYLNRYGIGALPALYLLDKEGHLVSTDARGTNVDRLEPLIRHFLGLPPLLGQAPPKIVMDTIDPKVRAALIEKSSTALSIELAKHVAASEHHIAEIAATKPDLKLGRQVDSTYAKQLAEVPEIVTALSKEQLTPYTYVAAYHRFYDTWSKLLQLNGMRNAGGVFPPAMIELVRQALETLPKADVAFVTTHEAELKAAGLRDPSLPKIQGGEGCRRVYPALRRAGRPLRARRKLSPKLFQEYSRVVCAA